VRNLERLLVEGNGIVGQPAIDEFNRAYTMSWSGIRDFLCMHYDCPRNDTPFWRDVHAAPVSESYAEIKQCFQRRTPRLCDIDTYVANGWQGIFHMVNWMFVAAPLGVVPPAAAQSELRRLPADARTKVSAYLKNLHDPATKG
jgi:tryptophan halogenase